MSIRANRNQSTTTTTARTAAHADTDLGTEKQYPARTGYSKRTSWTGYMDSYMRGVAGGIITSIKDGEFPDGKAFCEVKLRPVANDRVAYDTRTGAELPEGQPSGQVLGGTVSRSWFKVLLTGDELDFLPDIKVGDWIEFAYSRTSMKAYLTKAGEPACALTLYPEGPLTHKPRFVRPGAPAADTASVPADETETEAEI